MEKLGGGGGDKGRVLNDRGGVHERRNAEGSGGGRSLTRKKVRQQGDVFNYKQELLINSFILIITPYLTITSIFPSVCLTLSIHFYMELYRSIFISIFPIYRPFLAPVVF